MDVKQIQESITGKLMRYYGKDLSTASNKQIYLACAMTARDEIMQRWHESRERIRKQDLKVLYYLSVEFLQGRSLGNNLLNLGETENYKKALNELGIDINLIEEQEPDPGLGNGGLGRLASCFLDSLATLNLPAMGCGIRYEYGLFRQKIIDSQQMELPDNWLEETGCQWEVEQEDDMCEVRFGGRVEEIWQDNKLIIQHKEYSLVNAVPYDVPVIGYDTDNIGTLRLWSARSVKLLDMESFSRGEYMRAMEDKELCEVISKVLYPCENHIEGKSLRLKQHYFFTSATVQYIIKDYKKRHGDLSRIHEKVVIQINDTHPALAIPEFMRVLMDEEGMDWDSAWRETTRVFNYTNHTVMSEALERWPEELFKTLLPRIYTIIVAINEAYCHKLWSFYPGQWERIGQMAIIGYNEIRMANLCIASASFVNGVSQLHGDILKQNIFKSFFVVEPWKFLGITNGVTHRRWLMHANPGLTSLISDTIGEDFKKDLTQLENLVPYSKDEAFQKEFARVKRENKARFADWLMRKQGVKIDPDTVFDVQAKRLHEYKRQLLNILNIISLFDKLKKDPGYPIVPTTFIFGAKASPGYHMAKQTIRLINVLAQAVDACPACKDKLKVVFLENYNVSAAEMLIPAADISEQISTAGKEASGTGNMKFMMNGAVTLGTLDGANVEMRECLTDENIFIFGLKANETERLYRYGNYSAGAVYESSPELRAVLDYLVNDELASHGVKVFHDVHHVLLFGQNGQPADPYLVLKDFASYTEAHRLVMECYESGRPWWEKAVMNTAKSGMFSSDRTITEYNERIWNLHPVSM